MPINLQRLLFWLSVASAICLCLSLINYFLPINPSQPMQRMLIGYAVFGWKFFFSLIAFSLIRGRKIKAALSVVAVLIVFSIFYGVAVLLFEPLSAFAISIFLGELFVSGLLAYYSWVEARSYGLFQRAQ